MREPRREAFVPRLVVHEPLTQVDYVFDSKPHAFIERDHVRVFRAHLQIDLRCAARATIAPSLPSFAGHSPACGYPASLQIIDPSAMAFVPRHHRRDNLAIALANQKQFRLHGQLALDVLPRIVPRAREIALAPKRAYTILIFFSIATNYYDRKMQIKSPI